MTEQEIMRQIARYLHLCRRIPAPDCGYPAMLVSLDREEFNVFLLAITDRLLFSKIEITTKEGDE